AALAPLAAAGGARDGRRAIRRGTVLGLAALRPRLRRAGRGGVRGQRDRRRGGDGGLWPGHAAVADGRRRRVWLAARQAGARGERRAGARLRCLRPFARHEPGTCALSLDCAACPMPSSTAGTSASVPPTTSSALRRTPFWPRTSLA